MIRSPSVMASKGHLLLTSASINSVHDPSRKIPLLVQEVLSKDTLSKKRAVRLSLRQDPRLTREAQADDSDYSNSGWTRGHMARGLHHGRCPHAQRIAFLMTNICPQNAKMNRGAWNKLEDELCQKIHDLGSAILVTGSLFEDGEPLDRIGEGEVQVPTHLYKVLIQPNGAPKAWLMPNEGLSNRCTTDEFEVPVQQIAELSGFSIDQLTSTAWEESTETACLRKA